MLDVQLIAVKPVRLQHLSDATEKTNCYNNFIRSNSKSSRSAHGFGLLHVKADVTVTLQMLDSMTQRRLQKRGFLSGSQLHRAN